MVTFNSGGAPETLVPGNGYAVERLQYDALLEKTIQAAALKDTNLCLDVKDKNILGSEFLDVYQKLLRQEGSR